MDEEIMRFLFTPISPTQQYFVGMKKYTIGTFPSRTSAENAINRLHTDIGIDEDEVSYVYKNTEGDIKEVSAEDVMDTTTAEGAGRGAVIGGSIGVIAGLATVAGIIPVIGPIFAAGPLVAALGLGAGAVGTTAVGALTGAAAGGLIGALTNMGVTEERAQEYEDRVVAGNVLVAVHAEEGSGVEAVLTDSGATDIETFMLADTSAV